MSNTCATAPPPIEPAPFVAPSAVAPPVPAVREFALPRLALLCSGLIAAGTFIVAKGATTRFPPVELTCLRITLSAIIVTPIFIATRHGKRMPRRADILRLLALGLLGTVINQMCFLVGISMTRPVNGALLYAFTPVLVLIAAAVWLRERLTGLKIIGSLAALVGVVIVLAPRGFQFSSASFRGDLFILVAVFAWAAYTLLGKPILDRLDVFTVITATFVVGVIALAPWTVWTLATLDYTAPGWAGWLSLLYLSGMTSGVAFTLWYWALKRMEASQVAIFTNLQPPLTAALAWIFLGNVPDRFIVIGGMLVIAGVSFVQWPKRRVPAAVASELSQA